MIFLAYCNGFLFWTVCDNENWAGTRAEQFPDTIYFETSSMELLHFGRPEIHDYVDLRDAGLVP